MKDLRFLLETIADFVAGDRIMSEQEFVRLFACTPEVDAEENAFDVVFHTFTCNFEKDGILEAYADDRGGAFVSLEISTESSVAVTDVVGIFGPLEKDPYTGDGRSEFAGLFPRNDGPNLVNIIVLLDALQGGRITTINFARCKR